MVLDLVLELVHKIFERHDGEFDGSVILIRSSHQIPMNLNELKVIEVIESCTTGRREFTMQMRVSSSSGPTSDDPE